MKSSKETSHAGKQHGFTLTELLIVITIIAVLCLSAFIGARKAMEAAYKSRDARQMRDFGAAAFNWATENNYGEPMYFANGTGTFPHEKLPGKNPLLAPGNPAELLYSKDTPNDSYLHSPEMFFSPLVKATIPTAEKYDPSQASSETPWGTYVWLYPSTTAGQLTRRQLSAMGGISITKVGREANKNVLMANSYLTPRFGKFYHALFIDGSVRLVARSPEEWAAWFAGDNE